MPCYGATVLGQQVAGIFMAIDVHAHFVPVSSFEAIAAEGKQFGVDLVKAASGNFCCKFEHGVQTRPFLEGLTNLDMRREAMDEQGVSREIVSLWADVFGYGLPAEKGAKWHGLMNDHIKQLADKEPDRFSWMASVPLQDASLAAKELERSKAAGAVGVIVAANMEGKNLGECDLDDFWAACCSLSVPVFIHPALPVPAPRASKFGLQQICAYTADTTYTVGSMILSGVLDRYPDLQLLLSHGGGTLPYLIGRFDRMHVASNRDHTGDLAEHLPSAYLHRFYYDTILHDAAALHYLHDMVGVQRLMLGTDLPFPIGDPNPLQTLCGAGFGDEQIEVISNANPRSLFSI
jgi:aminocarboxymuconate-semialdehyde decarboxylase